MIVQNLPSKKLPIEQLRTALLQTMMRLADELPNVKDRSALAGTLRWLLIKLSTLKSPKRLGRPPEPTINHNWSRDDLGRRIISAALRLAELPDGRSRRSLLSALRHFRSEAAHKGRRGRPPSDRFRLVVIVAKRRLPGETNVRAISRRILRSRDLFMRLEKLMPLVADIIGIDQKKPSKSKRRRFSKRATSHTKKVTKALKT